MKTVAKDVEVASQGDIGTTDKFGQRLPAAILGDSHTCALLDGPKPHAGGVILPPCCPTVLIDFLPAAVAGNPVQCVSPAANAILLGSPTVYFGNKMAARMGDPTNHGGVIITGSSQVFIGGPVATVTIDGNGKKIVTLGSMTVKGDPDEVNRFFEIMNRTCEHSQTARELVAKNATSKYPQEYTLVRNRQHVIVDEYEGPGKSTVNMDFFEGDAKNRTQPLSYPSSPPANAPYANTDEENLVHILAESERSKEAMDGYDAPDEDKPGYSSGHAYAITKENEYRKEHGQPELVSSDYVKDKDGKNVGYENKYKDGSSEKRDNYIGSLDGKIKYTDANGNKTEYSSGNK
jgi:uncharacterized Zn-binding protein involved in type VI secretion